MVKNVPGIEMPADATAEMIGLAVVRILQESTEEFVEVDLQSAGRDYAEYLKKLGFKTVRAFERGARLVGVDLQQGEIKVLPFEPTSGGGFVVPVTSQKNVCAIDATAIGESVLLARDAIGL